MEKNNDVLIILGQSKMEKMQDHFIQIDKETLYTVFQTAGAPATILWQYLWGRCHGRSKIHTWPKKETIAMELCGFDEVKNKDEKTQKKWIESKCRTIARWLQDLEQAKIVKRIPAYNPNGTQKSNLYVLNASFPEIPEEWDTLFMDGVIIEGTKITARKNSSEIAYDKNVIPYKSTFDEPDENNENPYLMPMTEMSSHINRHGQIGHGRMTNLSSPHSVSNPTATWDQPTFFNAEKKNIIIKDRKIDRLIDTNEIPVSIQNYIIAIGEEDKLKDILPVYLFFKDREGYDDELLIEKVENSLHAHTNFRSYLMTSMRNAFKDRGTSQIIKETIDNAHEKKHSYQKKKEDLPEWVKRQIQAEKESDVTYSDNQPVDPFLQKEVSELLLKLGQIGD